MQRTGPGRGLLILRIFTEVTETMKKVSGFSSSWIVPAILCALALAGATGVALAQGGEGTMDWPQYRGPNRNGISGETGWLTEWPKSGPKALWKTSIGTGFSTVSVVDGRVYAMGHAGELDTVFCFDAETGKQLWKYSYECPIRDKQHEGGPAATPAVTDKYVFTLSREADFYCLDAKTGNKVWYQDLTETIGAGIPEWAYAGSPLIYNDWAIHDMGMVVAFEAATGKVVWKTKDYGAAYSSPAPMNLNGRSCIAVLPKTGLAVLDASDGSEIAFHPWETRYDVNAATPLVDGNRVFISSGYNRGCTFVEIDEKGQVKVLWENKNMRNHFNSSVLWKGCIYGFDEDELACLDSKTGAKMWSKDGLGKGSLVVAEGKLIVLSDSGELVLAEASFAGYQELGRVQVLGGKCWTVPVLSGHRIYARNAGGDLVCVDVRGG